MDGSSPHEEMGEYLYERPGGRPWKVEEKKAPPFRPLMYFMGEGASPLEVAYAENPNPGKPRVSDVRDLWIQRQAYKPSPLLLIILYREDGEPRAAACGPIGENPPVLTNLDPHQATRLADAALGQPNAQEACRYVLSALPETESQLPGIRNEGLFATHELVTDVPKRQDWEAASKQGRVLLTRRGRELVDALGFSIEQKGAATNVLRVRGDDAARAVAIFLEQTEPFEQKSPRFPDAPPISVALARAEAENLPYVVLTRGDRIRVYSTRKDVGVGRKGRSETYVEANLSLLPDRLAGFVPLIFGAQALAANGSFEALLERSRDFASDLGARLRERVYERVVPHLAGVIARREISEDENATDDRLRHVYEMAMTLLFRLLFIAYAEDTGLLPYRENEVYRRHALKTKARELSDRANRDRTDQPEFDEGQTDLWDELRALWSAVDQGNTDWGIPAYNGGLFTSAPEHSAVGAALARLRLTNGDVGPALFALLVDLGEEEVHGPVDFRALSVREFGTIYEGLLESSLAVAPTDLALDSEKRYVPAGEEDAVEVRAGDVYLQNRSGVRKSTGTYYTKHFAVEHLLEHALEPALDDHLERLAEMLANGEDAAAARAFFDFRCADIAMGSGHFLVAAVDHIEARLSSFLAEHPMPHVTAELERLRTAALERLGPLGEGWEIELSTLLRRQVARRCVYGVDLNPIAVELARLAIWIHTFVPGLPLSFLDHNLVHGNSLTGIGTLEEAVAELEGEESETLSVFGEQILGWLRRAEKSLQRLGRTAEASATEVREAEEAHRNALGAVQPVRDLFDLLVSARQGNPRARPEAVSDAGVLEHPQLDKARRESAAIDALHFPVRFPEVFLRDDPGFDCIIGNPPWEEATIEKDKFWARHYPGFTSFTQAERKKLVARFESERPDLVEEYERQEEQTRSVRKSLMAGPYPGMGRGDPDFYKAFCWRFWHLVRRAGWIGVVLPRSALMASGSGAWREAVLSGGRYSDVTVLLNRAGWVFDEAEHRYTIALVSIRKGEGFIGDVRLRGPYPDEESFLAAGEPAELTAESIREATGYASFPLLPTEQSAGIFRKLREHPSLGADLGAWSARPVTELHATNEKKQMILDPSSTDGLWPVYKGASFNLWEPDTGEYYAWADPEEITSYLQKKRLRQNKHARSAFSAFPRAWAEDGTTLPCLHARIAFRDIARATDTRTVIAALVPPHRVIANQAPYLLWKHGDARDEAYVLGVLASIPLDWYARRLVETHVNFHILNGFPIPRPGRDDPLRQRVERISGRLAARDDRFAEWADAVGVPVGSVSTDEQEDLVAELDALVSQLYGLEPEEVEHIFETFHEGWDHSKRLTRVLDHFDRVGAAA